MRKKIQMVGVKFNRWTVIKEDGLTKCGQAAWKCVCDCGTIKTIDSNSVRRGRSKSCGCYSKEISMKRLKTHGMSKTPTYFIWIKMKSRCFNPNDGCFKYYGNRGIKVCEQWLKFENFLKDMGERPPELTIERRNNDGDYEPLNCYWATRAEQSRNTRHNRTISFQGKTQCLADWANTLGIGRATLAYRLNKYSPEIAFNM